MGRRERYEPGTFCWVDLVTTDPASAKAFYGELFGWEAEDVPAGEAGTYTMLRSAETRSVASTRWRRRGASGASCLTGSPTLALRTPTQPPPGHASWAARCLARHSILMATAGW